MSTSIYWQPLDQQTLCDGCTTVARVLADTFGDYPITLTTDHLDILKGMVAASGWGMDTYKELVRLVTEHGAIRLDVHL